MSELSSLIDSTLNKSTSLQFFAIPPKIEKPIKKLGGTKSQNG